MHLEKEELQKKKEKKKENIIPRWGEKHIAFCNFEFALFVMTLVFYVQ